MKKVILSLGVLGLVDMVSAQQTILNNVDTIVTKSSTIIGGGLTNLLMGLTFSLFLISIITFLWKRRSGDDKGMNDAKNMLGWSVIAMFVMVAIWGLVTFISQTFGIGLGGEVARPSPLPVEKSSTPGANTPPGGNSFGLKASGAPCTNGFECISGKCPVEADGKGLCN